MKGFKTVSLKELESMVSSDVREASAAVFARDGNGMDAEPGGCISKYHNQPTHRGDIRFASKREAARYDVLMRLAGSGTITELRLQPSFTLTESYITPSGERIRALRYVADFSYVQNGQIVVEDPKGHETQEFINKRKLFMEKYPMVELRVLKGKV